MIGISKLYMGQAEASDPLRYGRLSANLPSHLLQFSDAGCVLEAKQSAQLAALQGFVHGGGVVVYLSRHEFRADGQVKLPYFFIQGHLSQQVVYKLVHVFVFRLAGEAAQPHDSGQRKGV